VRITPPPTRRREALEVGLSRCGGGEGGRGPGALGGGVGEGDGVVGVALNRDGAVVGEFVAAGAEAEEVNSSVGPRGQWERWWMLMP